MATRVSSVPTIDFSGPFFTKDPEKTIIDNVQKMMQGIATEGATAARTGLASGQQSRALIRELGDRVSDHVIGRVESRTGKEWHVAAVVQVYNQGLSAAESRSLMAAASYVARQTRAITDVTRQLRAARAVMTANLTAGIE